MHTKPRTPNTLCPALDIRPLYTLDDNDATWQPVADSQALTAALDAFGFDTLANAELSYKLDDGAYNAYHELLSVLVDVERDTQSAVVATCWLDVVRYLSLADVRKLGFALMYLVGTLHDALAILPRIHYYNASPEEFARDHARCVLGLPKTLDDYMDFDALATQLVTEGVFWSFDGRCFTLADTAE